MGSILIVEDDQDLCGLLAEELTNAGHAVIISFTLRDAVLKSKNQDFDLVITDIRLGEESGESLIDQIDTRSEFLGKKIPIIIMSGFLDRDLLERVRGKVQGALVKPFPPEALIQKVSSLLI